MPEVSGPERDAAKRLSARIADLEAQAVEAQGVINELHSRDALKTQFLSNISHDLRTPLTAIITHAEILRDGILGTMTDRQLQSVDGIIGGGRQLLDMIAEILVYAKGSGGQLGLTLSRFDLLETIRHVMSLNAPLAERKGLVVRDEMPERLPPVEADREKVTHVLTNLLGNAIAFTSEGGVTFRAIEAEFDSRRHIQVEVEDTGIGIRREHQELIFQEFAQVDSSPSRAHHGTGLGLAIARRLVDLHGGQLWVESVFASGSTFKFVLPVRQGE